MKPYIYLFNRAIVNYLKKIKNKPSRAIPIIFYVVFLTFLIVVSIFNTDEKDYSDPSYFIGVSTILLLCYFVFTIYSGITRKNFKYDMSDVNLIFTAPLRNQNILLYGFLKEVSALIVFFLILLFQLPNLFNNFYFVPGGKLVFTFALLLFLTISCCISLFLYGIFSRFPKHKSLVAKLIKFGSIILCLLLCFLLNINSNGNLLEFSINIFNEHYFNYIPVIGWIRSIFIQCLTGFNSSIIFNFVSVILTGIILIVILYNLKLDFFEDVLPSAEQNEISQSFKNGTSNSKDLANTLNNRKVSVLAFRKTTSNYSALYAKAIFYRHMLEYKKTGYFFLNLLSLSYFVASVLIGLFTDMPLYLLFFLSVYILFLSTYAGKWSADFNTHFIYLIPAKSSAKLFYSTLSSIIKYFIDGLIIFIPAGILLKANPIEIILSILAYFSFGAVSTYGAVLNYKLFDRVSNEVMKSIFMMLSLLLYVIPGIIVGSICSFAFELVPFSLQLSCIIYNILASLVIVQASKGIYDKIEL